MKAMTYQSLLFPKKNFFVEQRKKDRQSKPELLFCVNNMLNSHHVTWKSFVISSINKLIT